MPDRTAMFPVDERGDIIAWKAIVGAKASHQMSRPIFRLHRPNYSLDKGVVLRIKSLRRPTGSLPLDEDYAKRR